jgi:hypothetical protein
MRKDDSTTSDTYDRTDRIFAVGECYWFRTRENELQGPFQTMNEAYLGLTRYLELVGTDDVAPEPMTLDRKGRLEPVADPTIWTRKKA